MRVLDTQDMHALRRARQAAVEALDRKSVDINEVTTPFSCWNRTSEHQILVAGASEMLPNTDSTLCRELASIQRSDLTLLVSTSEYWRLLRHWQVSTLDYGTDYPTQKTF